MIISAVLNIINSEISNPSLLDANAEMSVYTPNGDVFMQKNEVNRLMESIDIEYDRIKTAIMKLAELKYDCCTYDDVPQKTAFLKKTLDNIEPIDNLDIELLRKCANYITVSHNATIGLELINGVKLNNITERLRGIECNSDTCE